MVTGNIRGNKFGSSGMEGAIGVQGSKTEDEKNNDNKEAIEEAIPDAVITIGNHEANRERHGVKEDVEPVTVSAGHGVNIAQTGADFMISIDFDEDREEVFDEDVTAVAGSSHPWKTSIDESSNAIIYEGKIYDSLLSITELGFTNSTPAVVAGDYVCLVYTYATEIITVETRTSVSYEPFTEAAGEVTTSVTPVAQILAGLVDPAALTVYQIARNNYALVAVCYDGTGIKTLRPL